MAPGVCTLRDGMFVLAERFEAGVRVVVAEDADRHTDAFRESVMALLEEAA